MTGAHNCFGIKARAGEPCTAVVTHEVVNGKRVARTALFRDYASLIVLEVATKGFTAFEADVEQFASMLIEEVVAKVKQTSLLATAAAILKLLGLTK